MRIFFCVLLLVNLLLCNEKAFGHMISKNYDSFKIDSSVIDYICKADSFLELYNLQ